MVRPSLPSIYTPDDQAAAGVRKARVLTVEECGIELYQAVQQLDFEGIIAKWKADPYGPKTSWYKIKNPAYTQAEGRGDLFERRA